MKIKKISECLTFVILLAVLFGCGIRVMNGDEQTESTQEVSEETIDETAQKTTEAAEVSTEGFFATEQETSTEAICDVTLSICENQAGRDGGIEVFTIVMNRDELDRYMESFQPGTKWKELSVKYDKEWFETHILLTLQSRCNSCNDAEIRWVRLKENRLEVCVNLMCITWSERPKEERDALLAARETGYVEELSGKYGCVGEYGSYGIEQVIEIEVSDEIRKQIEAIDVCRVELWTLPEYTMVEAECELQRVGSD